MKKFIVILSCIGAVVAACLAFPKLYYTKIRKYCTPPARDYYSNF